MRTAVIVGFLVLLLGGCKSNPFGDDVPPKLYNQVQSYEDTVRWGDLHNLYLFAGPDALKSAKVQDGLDNIRVTGYQGSPLRQVSETRWAVTAVIDYVLTDRQVVRQVVDNQVWVSGDDGKTWFLDSPLPQFR
ncbi:MAG: hypothetical protein KDI88_05095 [Gammaproteobacteria bacterium]|nr:hypothetical protein [Gammaproteobacteria bacterium]